jgi:hypothetical protein
MTRKDYVLIAEALARADRPYAEGRAQHRTDCEAIADALAQDNPRFDRERFLKAAGVQS